MNLNPFPFVKRQLKTKTGRFCLGVIAGSAVDAFMKHQWGVGVNDVPIVGAGLDRIFDTQVSAVLAGIALMKDRDIKVDQANGRLPP